MKKILENYKTTLVGFGVIAIATHALFEGKINAQLYGVLFLSAISNILSKDYNAKWFH